VCSSDLTQVMAHQRAEKYEPNAESHAIYNRLFAEYVKLHDYFGRGGNDVMKRLKALKVEVLHKNLTNK
jgi:L-ribulokinase